MTPTDGSRQSGLRPRAAPPHTFTTRLAASAPIAIPTQGAGGIGGLLARTDHSSITPTHAFYHSDNLGNITALVNSRQYVVARYLYDPFGNALSLGGPLADANVYRFSSQEFHTNSGLTLYLRRAY